MKRRPDHRRCDRVNPNPRAFPVPEARQSAEMLARRRGPIRFGSLGEPALGLGSSRLGETLAAGEPHYHFFALAELGAVHNFFLKGALRSAGATPVSSAGRFEPVQLAGLPGRFLRFVWLEKPIRWHQSTIFMPVLHDDLREPRHGGSSVVNDDHLKSETQTEFVDYRV